MSCEIHGEGRWAGEQGGKASVGWQSGFSLHTGCGGGPSQRRLPGEGAVRERPQGVDVLKE